MLRIKESYEYIGKLVLVSNGEEDDILGLEEYDDNKLVEKIIEDIGGRWENEISNEFVNIKYYISDVLKQKEEIEEEYLKQLLGSMDAKYWVAYSECTGYLWTTEDLQVGGHDLLEELKDSVGKFLYMSIDLVEKVSEGDNE